MEGAELLTETVTKRVTLSRYLFELALQNVRAQQETGDAACVTLLQDALEIFLMAALDHFNVSTKPKTEFAQYLDKLGEVLDAPLPYRRRVVEINKVRVAAKHDGISPNRGDVAGYVADTRAFLEEVCQKALKVDFWTVSLVALIEEGEAKTFIEAAEVAHKEGRYVDCLTDCRKAFFVTFEKAYDTQLDLRNDFALFGSSAPYYARDKAEIEKRVKAPFDYIVLDHARVDRDLMRDGIDHTGFWNVWRLTPDVYRFDKDDPWKVKHDPRLNEPDGLKERSAHVLATMTAIMLARKAAKMAARYVSGGSIRTVEAKPNAKFFDKADKNSAVMGLLPAGEDTVFIDFATQGLSDNDWYWRASWFEKGAPLGSYIGGYVSQDDLIFPA